MARPREFDRQAALQTAMTLFWRRGYEGVSVAELTSAMGIGAPSFYAAFGSKADLYRETLAAYQNRPNALTTRPLQEDQPLKSALEQVLGAAVRNVTALSPPCGCMISSGLLNAAPDHAELAELTASLRRDLLLALRSRFARAVQRGELPAHVRPLAMARYFAAIIHGLSIQARDGASQAELESTVTLAIAALPKPAQALSRPLRGRTRRSATRPEKSARRLHPA